MCRHGPRCLPRDQLLPMEHISSYWAIYPLFTDKSQSFIMFLRLMLVLLLSQFSTASSVIYIVGLWIEEHQYDTLKQQLLRSTTSEVTGFPVQIHTNAEPQFMRKEFRDTLAEQGVCHTILPLYHPNSNSTAERAVRLIKETLKKNFPLS